MASDNGRLNQHTVANHILINLNPAKTITRTIFHQVPTDSFYDLPAVKGGNDPADLQRALYPSHQAFENRNFLANVFSRKKIIEGIRVKGGTTHVVKEGTGANKYK